MLVAEPERVTPTQTDETLMRGQAVPERILGFENMDLVVDDEVEELMVLQVVSPRHEGRECQVFRGNDHDR